ncbi:ribonuclease D [Nakamurella silvestris]|nr:ribonuclease D [Nakamurella silvestris]
MPVDDTSSPAHPEPAPVPLLAPRDGFAGPLTDPLKLHQLAEKLAAGSGPVALDAERASGFRYSPRAYLVQLRRADVGTVLLDPIALGDLAPLNAPLRDTEWVLHAASQDLPCLADAGMHPSRLFDTELAGRLAGLPRVGLGPLVEQMLGLTLEKGHGAADWSTRPLPDSWLTYAALDVEVLVELRDVMAEELRRQGKLDWALEEFAAIVAAPPSPPRVDPWRRTSGIHKIRNRRALAVIRELWQSRDQMATDRDIAPHRILPDTAIVAGATAMPNSIDELVALPVFSGRMQRRQAPRWLAAINRARQLPDSALPPATLEVEGPPPASRWKEKNPEAAARLTVVREALTALSEQVSVPLENLVSPDLVRRICWADTARDEVADRLRLGGARNWQVELTSEIIVDALDRAGRPPAS